MTDDENEYNEEVQILVILYGTAEELFKLLYKSFLDFQILDSNTLDLLVIVLTANVMLGKNNSVGSRYKEKFPGRIQFFL